MKKTIVLKFEPPCHLPKKRKAMKTLTRFYLWTALAVGVAFSAINAVGQQSPTGLGQPALANKVFGHQVMSSDGQKVGNLNNLVIDLESGRILYGVIGTGSERVGVAPQIFTQTLPSGNELRVNVAKQKIDGAPKFGPFDKTEQLGQASYVDQVYSYFGQTPWWQGNTAANVGSFHNVHKASQLTGMEVQNVNNAKIGKIEGLAVDLPSGRVVYVILAPDSSLNLAQNRYLLPPQAVTLSPDHNHLVTGISNDQLTNAPHFTQNSPPNLSDMTLASQIYQYYGKQLWFNTAGTQPTGR
ncbi:MAG TPA: PRC-barrel domain-containing protein [Candidatus Limnocylindrales bacterium]|nr:PRC-barrel domain-containing protein [Candidatus Limnocylindrales bacterium]